MNFAARAARLALWLLPWLVCLAVYWPIFDTWFQQDDFAWLGLIEEVHEPRDLPAVLFEPRAQGTIRPWSERVTFLVSRWAFGFDALPFRLWVVATMFGSLILLQWIVRRLTASRLAQVAAPCLWLVNPGLATPMSWASAYNQVQCGFVLLLALFFLIKAIETGRRRFWVAQWIVFILGFGALEIVVVYPALATAYCWFFARGNLRRSLWLWIPSLVYTVVHFAVAEKPASGVYARHWDLSMAASYLKYWKAALGAWPDFVHWFFPMRVWQALALVVAAVLGALLIWAARRRDWVPFFGLVWFTAVLGPVLPLRDHISEYYLAVPSIGLALILGWALAQAPRSGGVWRAAGTALALIYVGLCLAPTRSVLDWRHHLGQITYTLVAGVADAQSRHPGKTILLAGIDSEMFWFGVYDNPFRLIGRAGVRLVPGSERGIDAHPDLGDIAPYVESESQTRRLLRTRRAVVYEVKGDRLEDVTGYYRDVVSQTWTELPPTAIDVGDPYDREFLGSGWYHPEGGFRWMAQNATFRIGAPREPGAQLRLDGSCPARHFERGPVYLTVTVDGKKVAHLEIVESEADFDFRVPLPITPKPNGELVISLGVDRTVRVEGDPRQFGLVFGRFEIVPPSPR